MLSLGALAFLNPWVLAGAAALPLLWWLLRAIPPSPRRQPFAGVRLLLGLEDPERQARRMPWWLLALRIGAVAAAIIGFATPVLNPSARMVEDRDGPLLLLMDQGWASAPDWEARLATAEAALTEAQEDGRDVIFWPMGTAEVPPVSAAAAVRARLDGLAPAGWAPDRAAVLAALENGAVPAPAQTLWLHDGLAQAAPADPRTTAALLDRLAAAGPVRLLGPEEPASALAPPGLVEGRLAIDVLRAGGGPQALRVAAIARTETGAERRVAVADAEFAAGETRAAARFDLPPELVREVSRLVLADRPSAGGAQLAGASVRRAAVGVVDPAADSAVISLTSASHYLRKALAPLADISEGTLAEVLERRPAAIVLADYGAIAGVERERLLGWIEEEGGLLIRFAGPRLAAAINEQAAAEAAAGDELLPVRLRRGGRVLGGALAWSRPRSLGPFDPDGIFRRLPIPGEVDVRTQVLAEPGPELAGRVWASLDDGTPLVTARGLGQGHVVLFHVTADAEWSSLPLSGLFVEMLGRLMALAPGQAPPVPEDGALAGTLWRASLVIGPDGTPRAAPGSADPVAGERLAGLRAGPGLPPGLYARADQGERRPGEPAELVIGLMGAEDALAPFPDPPSGVVSGTLGGPRTQPIGAWFLVVALLAALADILATLWITGRLARRAPGRIVTPALLLAAGLGALPAGEAQAQAASAGTRRAVEATAETTLAYVLTGEPRYDRVSAQGMLGLGIAVAARTAVEPGPPMGVDPETDELAFFPVIYWPLTAETTLSETALARLAAYLAGGGLLVIDTLGGPAAPSGPPAAQMREVARALNLPPLAPVDQDHVLTRAFYLLDRFPGRWREGRIWAEAAPPRRPGAPAEAEVPQFDRVDDNVSPVIVGAADWAAAWATDEDGNYLYPVGRPGDRQREMAVRFGVNLVLYALTGNYKSDQVHAPEVLRRLGQ